MSDKWQYVLLNSLKTSFLWVAAKRMTFYVFSLKVDPLVVNVAAVFHASIAHDVMPSRVARGGFCMLSLTVLWKIVHPVYNCRENVYCVRVYRPMKHLTETPSSHKGDNRVPNYGSFFGPLLQVISSFMSDFSTKCFFKREDEL